MQKYKHPDLRRRHKIKALLDTGHSQTKIAEIIGVHKSTISREISAMLRDPETAQRKTNKRHCDKRKHIRFIEDLKQQAPQWLRED